ncbi:hypothetical protein Natoc_1727 [Natronococcus occultus SP4]|uniref:Uncharacterized protein n=1 Tax=Natronococcus occultus SP4 TaxID=694430 RepID=L0JXN8_9EURY|nr:hypothetical protein Natoc_1727 [Natronococcus occultus SP4]
MKEEATNDLTEPSVVTRSRVGRLDTKAVFRANVVHAL